MGGSFLWPDFVQGALRRKGVGRGHCGVEEGLFLVGPAWINWRKKGVHSFICSSVKAKKIEGVKTRV